MILLHEQPTAEQRKAYAAYYTSEDVALQLTCKALEAVPTLDRPLRILEPSAGNGAFVEPILRALGTRSAEITLIEFDPRAVVHLQSRLQRLALPANVNVRIVCADFFDFVHKQKWDLVIGNPPFGRKLGRTRGSQLGIQDVSGKFLEALLPVADVIALIVPKYFLHNSEYGKLRSTIVNKWGLPFIWDLGEEAFQEANIETVALILSQIDASSDTQVLSKPLGTVVVTQTSKLADPLLPSWLLYRDEKFDEVLAKGKFGVFTPSRDRSISRKHHQADGVPLVRARDIAHGALVRQSRARVDEDLIPASFWRKTEKVRPLVVPNLSYYPRAAILPPGHYADGSAAMLFPRDGVSVSRHDLLQFSSEEFFWFYRTARNYSGRSLNIDSTAAYYFGIGFPDLGAIFERDTRKLKRLRTQA